MHTLQSFDKLARRRVLLVEPDSTLARVFGLVLTSGGYLVTTCPSGIEAVRRFREAPDAVHAVLVDTPPSAVGEGLARALHEIRPALPVILVMPRGKAIPPHQARARGIAAALEKPVDVDLLLSTVDSIFERVRLEA